MIAVIDHRSRRGRWFGAAVIGAKIVVMPETLKAAARAACRECGRTFTPDKPWWRICARCFRPARRPFAVARPGQLPGQLSMADTPEWAEAVAPNVVALRPRRAR